MRSVHYCTFRFLRSIVVPRSSSHLEKYRVYILHTFTVWINFVRIDLIDLIWNLDSIYALSIYITRWIFSLKKKRKKKDENLWDKYSRRHIVPFTFLGRKKKEEKLARVVFHANILTVGLSSYHSTFAIITTVTLFSRGCSLSSRKGTLNLWLHEGVGYFRCAYRNEFIHRPRYVALKTERAPISYLRYVQRKRKLL